MLASLCLVATTLCAILDPSPKSDLETFPDFAIPALQLLGLAVEILASSPVPHYYPTILLLPALILVFSALVSSSDVHLPLAFRFCCLLCSSHLISTSLLLASLCLHILLGVGRQPPTIRPKTRASRPMRILVLTIGTRGDVQPFLSFGQELQRRGHLVTVCAFGTHRELVERHGLVYASAGLDGIEQDALSWRRSDHVSQVMKYSLPDFTRNFVLLGRHFYEAAKGQDVLVAVSTTQSFAYSIAEKLHVPVWVVKLAPDSPTRDFPPPNYLGSRVGLLNLCKWLHHWFLVALAAHDAKMGPSEDEFRRTVLGLGPLKGGKRIREMMAAPNLCAYSPTVVRPPRDWGGNSVTTGWFLSSKCTQQQEQPLAPELDAFLGHKEDVVCITFGSMFPAADGAHLVELIVEALLKLSTEPVRVLVIRPQGPKYALVDAVRLHEVPEAPHHLVFPRCRLVVHHGGAGTTASVLESATPGIIVPILLWTDQPLWAERCAALGCALHVRQKLVQMDDNAESTPPAAAAFVRDMAAALTAAPALADKCAEVALLLRGECGVEVAADLLG